jgi:hypothetical protein
MSEKVELQWWEWEVSRVAMVRIGAAAGIQCIAIGERREAMRGGVTSALVIAAAIPTWKHYTT